MVVQLFQLSLSPSAGKKFFLAIDIRKLVTTTQWYCCQNLLFIASTLTSLASNCSSLFCCIKFDTKSTTRSYMETSAPLSQNMRL